MFNYLWSLEIDICNNYNANLINYAANVPNRWRFNIRTPVHSRRHVTIILIIVTRRLLCSTLVTECRSALTCDSLLLSTGVYMVRLRTIPNGWDSACLGPGHRTSGLFLINGIIYKAVPDGSVSNICSLIHLVILQSLGDSTFFKRAIQLNSFSYFTVARWHYFLQKSRTDKHTEPINGSKFHHST